MSSIRGYTRFAVIGVNYASFQHAKRFAESWAARPEVSHVVLVDNFSSDGERGEMRALGQIPKVTVLELDNVGYGSALNHALKQLLDHLPASGTMILMGNVDIAPVELGPVSLPVNAIPEIRVLEGRRNRNPFLTQLQRRLLPIYGLAARRRSPILLRCGILLSRVVGVIPSRTWAVHGAFFAVPTEVARRLGAIFSPAVFLYCEELYFARAVEAIEGRFSKTHITVSHVGGVSTGREFKSNRKRFFENWCKSMTAYLDD